MNAARDPPLCPFHFRMAGMTDENHLSSLASVITSFLVNLGDQRAGGIDDREVATLRLLLDFRRDSMRAEDGDGAFRDFIELLDEHGAFGAKGFDHVLIMNNLVPDIDRGTIEGQRTLDDLDRTLDTSAKAARFSEQYAQR
jgi:hypothetical protein